MMDLKPEQAAVKSTASRIQRVVSAGGIEAWLIEEKSVPLIAMEFSFAGGAALDGPGKSGLTTMLAGLLDEGAGPYDAQAFQERLDEFAIEMRFRTGRDSMAGSLKTLVRHKAEAFEMLRLALTETHIRAESVERVKAQILAGLRHQMNDPGTRASRAWSAHAFAGHPYGQPEQGIIGDVEALTEADARHHAARLLVRDRIHVSVVGAINAEQLATVLDHVFGRLTASKESIVIPAVQPVGLGETRIIDIDIPQSTIRFGMPGLMRRDDDFMAATVMNHILGGGSFTSRIWQEVREKRGLAYSVSAGLPTFKATGLFFGGTATKNERAKEALDVIRDEIAKMAADGPTAEELDKAKRYLIGSYALRFDTSTAIAKHLTAVQVDELGIDYTDRRNGLIADVTLDDCLRVSRRLFGDGRMFVTVAGRPVGM